MPRSPFSVMNSWPFGVMTTYHPPAWQRPLYHAHTSRLASSQAICPFTPASCLDWDPGLEPCSMARLQPRCPSHCENGPETPLGDAVEAPWPAAAEPQPAWLPSCMLPAPRPKPSVSALFERGSNKKYIIVSPLNPDNSTYFQSEYGKEKFGICFLITLPCHKDFLGGPCFFFLN